MRAGILNDVLEAEVVDLERPKCGARDVIVKTVRSGICGSDVSALGIILEEEFGHETGGYIAEVGSEVEGIKVGDRVWIHPINARPEGMCCTLGGFSEFVAVWDAKLNHNLFLLPDAVTYEEAALIEPFAVATHGKNHPGAKPGDHVLVYGAGTIGLCCVSALTAQGIIPVVIDINFNEYKTAFLKKAGAVICPIDVDKFEFLRNHFGETPMRIMDMGIDIDIVVDCAGVPTILGDFFKMGKPYSRLSVVGISGRMFELSMMQLTNANVSIMGSSGYDLEDIVEVIDNLANKRTHVTEIVTHRYPLEQLPEALLMAADRNQAIKVMIDME